MNTENGKMTIDFLGFTLFMYYLFLTENNNKRGIKDEKESE